MGKPKKGKEQKLPPTIDAKVTPDDLAALQEFAKKLHDSADAVAVKAPPVSPLAHLTDDALNRAMAVLLWGTDGEFTEGGYTNNAYWYYAHGESFQCDFTRTWDAIFQPRGPVDALRQVHGGFGFTVGPNFDLDSIRRTTCELLAQSLDEVWTALGQDEPSPLKRALEAAPEPAAV